MCTCGNTETHIIAKRQAFDGKSVRLWSDGAITLGAFNQYAIRGSRGASTRKALEAGWLAIEEACLYEHGEIRKLATLARRAVIQRSFEPRDYLRGAMAGRKLQAIKGGRVIQHARSCECPSCERTRQLCGGTAPFRGPRRIGF